jgi:hypothetical protein
VCVCVCARARVCVCVEWIHLVQDRDRWWALVNVVMNNRILAPRSLLQSLHLQWCKCKIYVNTCSYTINKYMFLGNFNFYCSVIHIYSYSNYSSNGNFCACVTSPPAYWWYKWHKLLHRPALHYSLTAVWDYSPQIFNTVITEKRNTCYHKILSIHLLVYKMTTI